MEAGGTFVFIIGVDGVGVVVAPWDEGRACAGVRYLCASGAHEADVEGSTTTPDDAARGRSLPSI